MLGVLLTVGAGVLIYVLLKDDKSPTYGPSMRPTINGPIALDIDDAAYEASDPRLNDIVSAQAPRGIEYEVCVEPVPRAPCAQSEPGYSSIRVIKRIVGLPGDRISFDPDGRTIRNGKLAEEPFINPCHGECGLPRFIVVPAGHYFLAGDNRPVSSDSRFWGAVPLEAIDGRVILPSEQ